MGLVNDMRNNEEYYQVLIEDALKVCSKYEGKGFKFKKGELQEYFQDDLLRTGYLLATMDGILQKSELKLFCDTFHVTSDEKVLKEYYWEDVCLPNNYMKRIPKSMLYVISEERKRMSNELSVFLKDSRILFKAFKQFAYKAIDCGGTKMPYQVVALEDMSKNILTIILNSEDMDIYFEEVSMEKAIINIDKIKVKDNGLIDKDYYTPQKDKEYYNPYKVDEGYESYTDFINSSKKSKNKEIAKKQEKPKIRVEDIIESDEEYDVNEIIGEIDSMIGLDNVKKEIRNIVNIIQVQKLREKRGLKTPIMSNHLVFTGNPGTGKTTVARIMSDVFRTLGILSRGHLVEADRSKLVAGYSGQTAIKTNQLIDSAIGGVLFIDEAYTLKSSDNDSFGTEAIDTLLKRLEDDRGKFICIVAGYTNQMHDFINSNPGLKSRFTHTIHFDDYSADELTQIFVNLAESRHFKVDDKAKSGVNRLFEQLYLRRDKNFGNAREVRKIFDATIEQQSQRLVKDISNSSNTEYDIYDIIYDDLPLTQDQNAKSIDQVLNELDEFIGMRSVKNMIRRLAVQSMFMKQRSVHGVGKTQQICMNFILTGNPGTGKTTLARKMGEILQSMEILPSSKVIEVSRATLIGK